MLEHLLCHPCVCIEHRLGDSLVQSEVLRLYLTETEYSEDGLNDGIGRLQLEDRPGVTLAEGLDLRGRRRLVIPRVLQLLLVHVVHGLDLTDQPVLPIII